jgi:hypothetical protein
MQQKPLIEDIDYYLDEQGLLIFTRHYHLNRGYCCGMGCRHCPFGYENVPEPKKSKLIKANKSPEQ